MIWPRLYRHSISESLAALETCEREALGKPAVPVRYRRMGRLLLRDDYINNNLSPDLMQKTDAAVRFVTGSSPAFWKATKFLAQTELVASTANAILLKNNIRAFFVADGLTLKVSNPGEADAARRVAHEADIRRGIVAGGRILAPEALGSGKISGSSFLLEKLLEGWSPFNRNDQSFVESLIAFQRANSVLNTNTPETDKLLLELGHVMAALNLTMPSRLEHALSKLAKRHVAPEPWGIFHGDLSRSNIFEREGQWSIIDWEFAGYGPITVDAIRLSTQFSKFASAYVDALGHIDARAWLLIACVRSILEHHKRWMGLADNHHSAAVQRKTARKAREILAFADELAREIS
jgi:hypothetical protein